MSNRLPRVSAVISVVDPHPVYFRQAVASILGQTVDDFELLIIEEQLGRSVTDVLHGINDQRIRHYCHPHRTSLVEQRNRGLKLAQSDYIALLDADDICFPERFEKQIRFLEEHPEVAVLGSDLEIIDSTGKTIGYRTYPTSAIQVAQALRLANPLAQPSVMYRKAAVIEAGGYQYTRFKYVEDYELWCRMATRGYKLANIPEPLIRYRIHASAAKSTSLRESLLGTIDVKKIYFSQSFGLLGRIRFIAEYLLLLLPSRWVIRFFLAINVQKRIRRR